MNSVDTCCSEIPLCDAKMTKTREKIFLRETLFTSKRLISQRSLLSSDVNQFRGFPGMSSLISFLRRYLRGRDKPRR